MASNLDGEKAVEMGTPHSHSDGEEQGAVNSFHAAMTSGPGSSQEQYDGTSKTDEKEVTDSPVQDSEASTGTPKVNDGKAVGQ